MEDFAKVPDNADTSYEILASVCKVLHWLKHECHVK